MNPILWITREEWLRLPEPGCVRQIPKEILFIMPLDEIRARFDSPDPRFTPKEDEDFPGPVERWYGAFCGKGFTLTYHYRSPVTNQVVASHSESDEFSFQLEMALKAWRDTSPL